MRWKTVAAVVVLLLGLAAVVLVAPVLWLTIDEAAVPPASDAPSLPEHVMAAHQGVHCGSGGCWREWTLSGPASQSGTELADALDMSGERCAARSWLDRREVCTWVQVIGGEARLFLRFDRPWD